MVDVDPVSLDGLFRFSSYRMSSLASLRSLLWIRAQQVQDRVVGRARASDDTAFGQASDMRTLGQRFVERGRRAVEAGTERWRLSPWVCELRSTAGQHNVRLALAELPMPETYAPVRESALGRSLRTSLPRDFCGAPLQWVDLHDVLPREEAIFPDGLHLARTSAPHLSRRMGCEAALRATSTAQNWK
jgi:hypothetical protein